jgi:hypothetical protein
VSFGFYAKVKHCDDEKPKAVYRDSPASIRAFSGSPKLFPKEMPANYAEVFRNKKRKPDAKCGMSPNKTPVAAQNMSEPRALHARTTQVGHKKTRPFSRTRFFG